MNRRAGAWPRTWIRSRGALIYHPFALSPEFTEGSKRSLYFTEESFDKLRMNGVNQRFPSSLSDLGDRRHISIPFDDRHNKQSLRGGAKCRLQCSHQRGMQNAELGRLPMRCGRRHGKPVGGVGQIE